MLRNLGIMQGRLTEWDSFNPQQFPWISWENEFHLARKYGIAFIEWMFNSEDYYRNPIWIKAGIKKIKLNIDNTGILVSSICANFYMDNPIWGHKNLEILNQLLENADKIGAKAVIIPLFGRSYSKQKDQLEKVFQELYSRNRAFEIDILVEADLTVGELMNYECYFHKSGLKICYDIGNAVGNKHDVCRELEELKAREILGEIHLKDKNEQGNSVHLGTGMAEFKKYFSVLEISSRYVIESYYDRAIVDTVKAIEYIKSIER